MKNKRNFLMISAAISLTIALSACGTNQGAATTGSPKPSPTADNVESDPPSNVETPADADKEILIIIDQTPKPIEGSNSFDFFVNKRPEGYALNEMRWKSDKREIVSTVQEAIERGGTGGDGFYISGDAQFSGFFYPDEMKGEKGEASFLFKNEAGDELVWKKEITLK